MPHGICAAIILSELVVTTWTGIKIFRMDRNHKSVIARQARDINHLSGVIANLRTTINTDSQQNTRLQSQLRNAEAKLQGLVQELTSKTKLIARLDGTIDDLHKTVKDLKNSTKMQGRTISEHLKTIAQQGDQIKGLEVTIVDPQ